jgi:hypothetical protein
MDLAGALKNIGQAVGPLAPVSLALAGALAQIIAAAPPGVVQALAIAWLGVGTGLRFAAAMMTAFSIAADLNPVGLIVLAVAGLVFAFVLAYKKGTVLRTLLGVMWGPAVSAARTAIVWILGLIDKFLGGLESIATAAGHLPGPLGAPFRAAAGAIAATRGKVRELATSIANLHGKTVNVNVTGNSISQVAAIQGRLAGLHNRTVVVNVVRAGLNGLNGVLPAGGYAFGTTSARPGWKWVGERGPELMRFRGGEQVLPADVSSRVASGGRGGDVHVHITVNGALDPDAVGRQIDSIMSRYVRGNGGRAPSWAGA